MRIIELSIRNFRGIRDLTIKLGGNSAAILGPNGTGKSSIVDAIDFLVRGAVRRLEGEGAGELSLSKHAPLVGVSPQDSWVEALLASPTGAHIRVKRTVAAPAELTSELPVPADCQNAMRLAREGGHHLLTRRELLHFVFTEPSSRASAVGALLQLDGVDSSRKELQGASRDAATASATAKGKLSTLSTSAQNSFSKPLEPGEALKDRVNFLRGILDGSPIEDAIPGRILWGLTSPAQGAIHPLQSARNQSLLRALVNDTIEPMCKASVDALRSYLADASRFRGDDALQHALRSADLIERGIELLDHDECPLCLTQQSQTQLRTMLDDRAAQSSAAVTQRLLLEARRLELIADISARSQRTSDVYAAISQKAELPVSGIAALHAALGQVSAVLLRPLEDASIADETELEALQIALESAATDIAGLRAVLQALPATSQLQSAWDQLSQFSKALVEQRAAARTCAHAEATATFLKRADECFLSTRDAILQATYDAVAVRMADVYRQIHGSDEGTFAAEMAPTRAGLKLAVEFRGLGRFPPSALHSEGHQDSMGLCFFLALSSHLAGDGLPFIVLDDVVMSVDYGHRRGVASVLATEFGDRQLIITTHDRVWWRQLRTAGVVNPENSIEFIGWTIEDGPRLAFSTGANIAAAREALARGNAPQTAHALRRAIEETFPDICDALGASVRYRADGTNDAGDFLQAALGRLKDLVGMARSSAQGWKMNDDVVSAFAERRAAACADFSDEQWLVNPTLHFNSWTANMSVNDLQPVVDTYERLFSLFSCENCKGPLTCVENGRTPSMLRCRCTHIAWNLEKPPKTK